MIRDRGIGASCAAYSTALLAMLLLGGILAPAADAGGTCGCTGRLPPSPPRDAPPPPPPPPPPPSHPPPSDAPPAPTDPSPPPDVDRPGGEVTPDAREPSEPTAGDPPATPPPESEPSDAQPPSPDDGPTAPEGPTTGFEPPAGRPSGKGASPGSSGRRRGSATSNPEWSWSTWWYFNRWSFLPSRNELLQQHFFRLQPVTGDGVDPMSVWGERRDHLAREVVAPALMHLLARRQRPAGEPIRGSAALSLARLANDAAAVEAVLRLAEDPHGHLVAREAAVMATGLFRRSEPARQMPGERLDALRRRLLDMAGSERVPLRLRCLAVLAIGMLADQPYGGSFPAGLAVSAKLWTQLRDRRAGAEMTIALLTALGLQPPEGIGDAIFEGLQSIVAGKRFGGRRWNEWERAHALCTLVRLGGPGWQAALFRVLAVKRALPARVRSAAFIALGARAADLDASERMEAWRAWDAGRRLARDPLTKGLACIALGRLLAADLAAERGRLFDGSSAAGDLLRDARIGPGTIRGFALLGLALAAREARPDDPSHLRFRAAAIDLVTKGLQAGRGDGVARGAYAVAAGLLGVEACLPLLEPLIRDPNADAELRGFAAVASGQIGRRTPSLLSALRAALLDRRSRTLRREAAIALAFLTGTKEAAALRAQMQWGRTRRSPMLGHIAMALGQMGDLGSVEPLVKTATDPRSQYAARGAAATALGLICDPEPRPSLARLWRDVNYPSRTASLHAALDYY